MTMRKGLATTVMAAGLLLWGYTQFIQAKPPQKLPVKPKPRVEVVFCLDTTGSMGGLIDGAKQKIWSICNQIVGGQPTPEVKVGLVAYRDRGDEYVTKSFDLSGDLDDVHSHLMKFEAAGGGDEPESVNEALRVAVTNMQWSTDQNVLRIIYLVGDAPPHMDYANDITYKVTCKKARDKGIIVNTIQCGNIQATTPFWKEIAQNSQGRFVQIAQDGGVVTVCTPYDQRLAEINVKLAQTSVVYGDAHIQVDAYNKAISAALPMAPRPPSPSPRACLAELPPSAATECVTAAADRACYNAKTGQVGAWDLIDNIKAGNVKLENLKTEQLPEPMQTLNLSECRAYLAKVESERSTLQSEARELDRQRTEYINQETTRRNGQQGFDAQVLEMLREQAKAVHIAY